MPHEIVLSGDIGIDITAQGVRSELEKARGADVNLLINSRGGLVFAGVEIFNVIRNYSGKTTSIITGLAASMGSYVALAANSVKAHDNATFMIHNAVSLVLGDHNDMRKRADALEGMSNILAKLYVAKTGKALNSIKALMDNETFMFGNEMHEAGFVDEIIDAPEDGEHDKESAIMDARASVESCLSKLRNSEAANNDLERAVAYMDSMALLEGPEITANKKKTAADPDDDGGCGGGT